MAWLRDRPWKWLLQLPLPRLGLIQPTPRALVEPIVRRHRPGRQRRLGRGRRRRVPARLPHPSRALRLLRVRAQHLPGRAARRRRVLAPARGRSRRDAMFVWGRQDKLVPIAFRKHVERALPARAARRARLRPRPAARGPGPDPRGHPPLPRQRRLAPPSIPADGSTARTSGRPRSRSHGVDVIRRRLGRAWYLAAGIGLWRSRTRRSRQAPRRPTAAGRPIGTRRSLAVSLPPGWHVAPHRLVPALINPRELLSLGPARSRSAAGATAAATRRRRSKQCTGATA